MNKPPYMGFTPEQKQIALATIRNQGLYTVVSEKAALKMEQAGLEGQVREYSIALNEGGVSTFEITARYYDWEKAVGFIPKEIIKALGTQANILTLFRAIRAGVMVNVAAKNMAPLIGQRAVVPEQLDIAKRYEDTYGIWCACGFRGPVFCLDPIELKLEKTSDFNDQ